MSQATIFGFGVAVFFLGGIGLVLIGLDAFRSWSRDDVREGAPAFRAAEAGRAADRRAHGDESTADGAPRG
jgi:hypothetical protein